MSARKRRLIVRSTAEMDIEDALLYTLRRWGQTQRRRYRAQLYQAMRSRLDYPERGRS